jgi:hypothetical protein
MKILYKPILSVLLINLFFASQGVCSSADVGTSGASFLKLASGARAAAMAGAFSAVPNGGSDAVYWNPAVLSRLDRKEASFMYSSYFEDIAYGWASFAMPLQWYGVFAAGLQYLSYGDLDEKDSVGNPSSDISMYDMALYLSYSNAFKLMDYGILNYGLSLKYIYSKIEDSASAIAFDGAFLFTLNDNITSFAFVFQNAGTGLQYDLTSAPLPFIFKLAASRILFKNLIVDIDVNIPYDNDIFPSLGAEYKLNVNQDADLFIRAGYTGRDKYLPGFAGFNAGFGARFSDYFFDYAFSPYGDLGYAHRVSAGIKFGERVSKTDGSKKSKRTKPAAAKKKKQPEKIEQNPLKQDVFDKRTVEAEKEIFEGGYSGAYIEEEKPIKEVAKNAGSAVILELSSQQISKNERTVYAQMLRNAVSAAGRFRVLSKQATGGIYLKNSIPSKEEIKQIFKQTGAEIIIVGNIEQMGKTLEFSLYSYDEDLNEKELSFQSENSFRDVKSKMRETVKQIWN